MSSNTQIRKPGTLWVVGTPLGNPGDLSPRARACLEEADLVLAEDTKREGLACARWGVTVRRFVSYHDHNEKEKAYIEARRPRFSEIVPMGAALKFAKIAEGSAEISYRFSGGTKEWDVAPGNLILEEAGGIMVKPDGSRYSYNREDVYNREGYILANCPENLSL